MSAGFLPRKGLTVSFSILTPNEENTTDDVLNFIMSAQEEYHKIPGLIAYAILKTINGTKVGAYSIYEEGTVLSKVLATSPVAPIWTELASKAERTVAQYDLVDFLVREGATLEIVGGLVLSFSVFQTPDAEKQAQALSHMHEHLKSTFDNISGLKAGTLLKSEDGTKIAVLGYWDSVEAVAESLQQEEGRFATLKSLVADMVSRIEREVFIVHFVATI